MQYGESTLDAPGRRAPIIRTELDVSVDPGHGGLHFVYRVERIGTGFRVSAAIHQSCPTPGAIQHRAMRFAEELHRDPADVETFLRTLVERHAAFELADLETVQGMLHPTSFRFRVEDAMAQVNQFRYRIECGKHRDAPHAELVRAFEQFFDKAQLVARFGASAGPLELTPPRPWWKFWSRR